MTQRAVRRIPREDVGQFMAAKAKRLRRYIREGGQYACSQTVAKNWCGIAYRETCMTQPVAYIDVNDCTYCMACGLELTGYKEKI